MRTWKVRVENKTRSPSTCQSFFEHTIRGPFRNHDPSIPPATSNLIAELHLNKQERHCASLAAENGLGAACSSAVRNPAEHSGLCMPACSCGVSPAINTLVENSSVPMCVKAHCQRLPGSKGLHRRALLSVE
jgi:hypothetical protein